MESWVGGRLPLEMYGELGRWTTATRNVWRVEKGTTVVEMYGELGMGTTATRNVWSWVGDDCH